MKVKELAELGENLLKKKSGLNSLWQDIAENFYPERADFTSHRWLGEDFASNLMNSYPITARRDLGNQFGTMLRPTARPWFHVKRKFAEGKEDLEVKQKLEYFERVQRRAMYDKPAMFTKAAKQADHDYASFGQLAMSVELGRYRDTLKYRTWHLRDMAWQENADGDMGYIVRQWKPTLRVLADHFPKESLHEEYQRKLEKDPFCEVRVLHMVFDAEMFGDENAMGRPRWSIYWDAEHNEVIEKTPIWGKHYIISRWNVVGSQYAYSPAVVAALPDARLIQAMAWTLLEVSEKAANPPLIATQEQVRSDIATFAGGITWVDADYDERLGEVLRPISQDFRGIQYGMQMQEETRMLIHKAFYLDTLTLPERAPEMTAYEVGQRVQEYIRNALPIFEPAEYEYNGAICDETFDLLMRNGAFGSPLDFPRSMKGMEVDFNFESPLHDLIDQAEAQKWTEAVGMLASAIELDPSTAYVMDAQTALRDALTSTGVPAKWINSEDEVTRAAEYEAARQQQEVELDQLKTGSEAAVNLSKVQQAQQV